MKANKTLLVTGGCGFIGSNLARLALKRDYSMVNLDKLTYAGNRSSLTDLETHPGYAFVQGDIRDRSLVAGLLATHCPCGILHLAAESHVDRSIDGPEEFIQTNIVGSFRLLEAVRPVQLASDLLGQIDWTASWLGGLEAVVTDHGRGLHASI